VSDRYASKAGQRFLAELIAALDALPHKRLSCGPHNAFGDCCSLVAMIRHKPAYMQDCGRAGWCDDVAATNDGGAFGWLEPRRWRWVRMRAWASSQIAQQAAQAAKDEQP
jgi:hypothetical protein